MSSVVDLQIRRWKKYEEILLEKLNTFGRQICTESALNHALEMYWGNKGLSSPEFDDDASFARFFEWFLFDYKRNSRSRRVIERFRATFWDELCAEERQLLQGWLDSHLGIFEITGLSASGDGVTMVDLFTGEKVEVFERGISRSLHKFDLILARPLKVFDIHGLSVAALVIPRSWKRSIESLAEYELARYRRRHPDVDWYGFLRNRSHRINRILVDLSLNRPEPRLQTVSGEEVLLARAWFDVTDPAAAAAALDGIEALRRHKEGVLGAGSLRAPTWIWLGVEGPLAGNLVLGEISLADSRLRLQCLSRQRLEAGKALLKERLGGLVHYRLDDFRIPRIGANGYPMMAFDRQMGEEGLSPEIAEILRNFLENYYQRWVDDPVPALSGRSPRQACGTGEGRAQVIELLKYMENVEAKKKQAGQPHFEVNLLRRELGLPEED